jgi:cyclopropane-fatty-acyl-phospholipid synthase
MLLPKTLTHRPGVAASVREVLGGIAAGRFAALPVTLRFWDGSVLASDRKGAPVVEVRDPSAIAQVLHAPNQIGLARAWVTGALAVDNDDELEAVLRLRGEFPSLRLTARERVRVVAAAVRIAGPGVLRRPAVPSIEAQRPGRLHSLGRDQAAIRHHYDVSNHFYRLLLGPSLVYSCAYFDHPGESLEAAQERKLELICRKLRLAPGERLLDIGCGWGSLLIHAAQHHGVHGVGVTLSDAQAELARERIEAAGLSDRIEIRVSDYREITDGPFDKISSVGMYEHVGREQLDPYAQTLHDLLAPGGLFLNHGIARLHSEPPPPDTFLTRYVFPDGELHPVTDVMTSMEQARLEIRDVESLREHYTLTLRGWLANLEANQQAAIAEIGPERERVWRLYMLASALGFEAGDITVYQVLGTRPDAPHGLPLRRAQFVAPVEEPACVEGRSRRAHLNGATRVSERA